MSNGEMIKEIRKRTGLSQKEFAFLFEIPMGTYRNWEQGRTNLPDYVFNMLHMIISTKEEVICNNLEEDETLEEGWKKYYTLFYINR